MYFTVKDSLTLSCFMFMKLKGILDPACCSYVHFTTTVKTKKTEEVTVSVPTFRK